MGGSRASLYQDGIHYQAPVFGPSEPQSLKGIPEYDAVQEFAFRAGQRDHGNVGAQPPSSPFIAKFDDFWLEYYVLGKKAGGIPREAALIPQQPLIKNFDWIVLTNPYTQDLEHPEGGVDLKWVSKICELSLNGMEALIGKVCQRCTDRGNEWWRLVCDVPSPVREVLPLFKDMEERYQRLLKDAKEAKAGGRPVGY